MQDRITFHGIDPTKDAERIQTTLSRADSIVVVKGYTYDPRKRKNNKVLARSRDMQLVAGAVGAIDPDFAAERRHWMTPGRPTIAFLEDRDLLATFHCLNPGWVRATLWDGWAPLQNEDALLDVLVVLATQMIKERLDAGQHPDPIAKEVRSAFDLSAGLIADALVRCGLPVAQARSAARSTMTDEELASNVLQETIEVADDNGPAAVQEPER